MISLLITYKVEENGHYEKMNILYKRQSMYLYHALVVIFVLIFSVISRLTH